MKRGHGISTTAPNPELSAVSTNGVPLWKTSGQIAKLGLRCAEVVVEIRFRESVFQKREAISSLRPLVPENGPTKNVFWGPFCENRPPIGISGVPSVNSDTRNYVSGGQIVETGSRLSIRRLVVTERPLEMTFRGSVLLKRGSVFRKGVSFFVDGL